MSVSYFDYMKIGFFNINGLVGETTFDPDFKNFMGKYDIAILTETWHNEAECINKIKNNFPKNFHFIENARKNRHKKSKRNSGGILICYKKFLHNYVTVVDKTSENMIWIKIRKEYLNTDRNLFVGGIYNSPINSTYTKARDEDLFLEIQNRMLTVAQNEFVIVGGDFNARVGNMQDHIEESEEEKELLNLPDIYTMSQFKKLRCNQDQHKNSFGEKLIDMATSTNLKILNGRTLGDLEGRYTYVGYNGLSTVDYVLGSENLFLRNHIHSFEVEQLTLLSDHRPTCLTLQYSAHKETEKEGKEPLLTSHKRYKYFITNYAQFKTILQRKMNKKFTESLIQQLQNVNTHNDSIELDNIIQKINAQYLSSANTSHLMHKTNCNNKKGTKRTKQKTWYTKDSKTLKRKLNQVRKMLERNPNKQELRTLFYKTQKQYKNLIKSQRKTFEENMMTKLEHFYSYDKNNFWKHLKSMKGNTKEVNLPPLDRLITHFENLYYKEELNDDLANIFEDKENRNRSKFNMLNKEIIEEEVRTCINSLKSRKSPGEDQISNEMIKGTNEEGITLLTKLFNTILNCGYFPKDWNYGLLRLIHKGSDTDDENNYRAITLNSCLGKLFCTILNQRINPLIEQENMFCNEQGGFRKNRRATDQIFLLKNIVRRYVTNNKYLYTCFVDFSKAFDSIWRKALIGKLSKLGVNGKFLDILRSIYNSTTNSIIYNDDVSALFKSNMGVKQGDTLSTTLFNIFINDLSNEFAFDGNNPVTVGGTEISCLLYADDLIIMSTTHESLQKCITKLEQYCITWKLEVNLKKTKIMIFNKQGALIKKHQFLYKESIIENVREYKYLGFTFSCSGSDNTGINNLLKQAKKAWFSLQYYLRTSKNKKISTYLHLFDTQIKPILLYACESWADSLKCDRNILDNIQKNTIERFHVNVLKQLLGVHKKTSNLAVLLETGRHTLAVSAQLQAVKYFLRFPTIKQGSLLRKYYEMEKLYSSNNDKFIPFITSTLNSIGMSNIWREQLSQNRDLSKDTKLIKTIKLRLKDISSQTMISTLKTNPGKLDFLARMKIHTILIHN